MFRLKVDVSRFTEAPWGQPDYFQITELSFDDKKALDAAIHNPEMGEAAELCQGPLHHVLRRVVLKGDHR